LQGAAYHTIASFQAYTTNAIKFFVGNVTSGQAGTYGSITANRTNGTTWLSLGSTNWIRFTGAINEF
jgi:Na+/H+-translocating membrane pyrophosphatase